MVDSEKVVGLGRTTIAYAIWIAILVVIWRAVLSLDWVRSTGFALQPFQSDIYPGGLPWILIVDASFYTLLIVSVVKLGRNMRRSLIAASGRFRRLGNVARLGGILAAIIIGYYGYDELVYPLLYSQDVTWAYNLLLWVLLFGVAAAVVFELVCAVSLAKRSSALGVAPAGQDAAARKTPKAAPPIPAAPENGTAKCPSCGKELPANALFCGQCGTRVSEIEG